MTDQRVLKKLDQPSLVADGPGCWDCPSWQRKGGPGSAAGTCKSLLSNRGGWLTGYSSLCPQHPKSLPSQVAP